MFDTKPSMFCTLLLLTSSSRKSGSAENPSNSVNLRSVPCREKRLL